jgi:hypothetical protein
LRGEIVGEPDVVASSEAGPDGRDRVEIVVNAERHFVQRGNITFEEVANLAYNNNPPSGPNVVITITYSKGERGQQGSLTPGEAVKVKEGMIFNVRATDRS